MAKYERKAGTFSEAETFMKIIDLLRELEDQCSILGHYKKENGHELAGQGFLAVSQMMHMTAIQVTNLATGKMRKQAGYR